MNRKDLQAPTLVGQAGYTKDLYPLAVLHLDNWLVYILKWDFKPIQYNISNNFCDVIN